MPTARGIEKPSQHWIVLLQVITWASQTSSRIPRAPNVRSHLKIATFARSSSEIRYRRSFPRALSRRLLELIDNSGRILAHLLGCLSGRFFTDLFFDFAAPFAREPGPQHSVKQIRQEQNRWHPFIIQNGDN